MTEKRKIYFLTQVIVLSLIPVFFEVILLIYLFANHSDLVEKYFLDPKILTKGYFGNHIWMALIIVKIFIILFCFQVTFALFNFVQAVIMRYFIKPDDLEDIFKVSLNVFDDVILFPVVGRYYREMLGEIIR